jgi:preprotein translocase subunit SecA
MSLLVESCQIADDGLHQAIEAKEKLQIRQKQKQQQLHIKIFLLYPKLSGMTGTGKLQR